MLQPKVQELTQVIEGSRLRIDELTRLLREERLRFQDLVSQLLPLLHEPDPPKGAQETTTESVPPEPKRLTRKGREDRRSEFNPEKCLKITARRTLEWSKRYQKSVEAAQVRVNAKVQERAKHYGLKTVPKSVQSYIALAVLEYESLVS